MEEKKNKKNLDSKHTLNFSFNEYCDGNKNIKEIVRNTHFSFLHYLESSYKWNFTGEKNWDMEYCGSY